jgi:hypothetical protein
VTPNRLWRLASCDRATYLRLLREHGYVYEREDGITVHTERNPRKPADLGGAG